MSEPLNYDERIRDPRYALRQCYTLARRMVRKADQRESSSAWNHIIRFCKDADTDGTITESSILRQPPPDGSGDGA